MILYVEDKPFKTHKVIINSRCKPFAEAEHGKITGISKANFAVVMNFLYHFKAKQCSLYCRYTDKCTFEGVTTIEQAFELLWFSINNPLRKLAAACAHLIVQKLIANVSGSLTEVLSTWMIQCNLACKLCGK
jgi:hypothetical protein